MACPPRSHRALAHYITPHKIDWDLSRRCSYVSAPDFPTGVSIAIPKDIAHTGEIIYSVPATFHTNCRWALLFRWAYVHAVKTHARSLLACTLAPPRSQRKMHLTDALLTVIKHKTSQQFFLTLPQRSQNTSHAMKSSCSQILAPVITAFTLYAMEVYPTARVYLSLIHI